MNGIGIIIMLIMVALALANVNLIREGADKIGLVANGNETLSAEQAASDAIETVKKPITVPIWLFLLIIIMILVLK